MMKGALENITEAVGHTPIVKLNRVTQGRRRRHLRQVRVPEPRREPQRPRRAQHDRRAEEAGLKPGGTIVEATSGNTGASLALIAAIKGYKCVFVMPDKMSQEKIASLRAFGARVVVCPTAVEADDPRSYYQVAKRIADETPNSFYANQYHNPANPEGHYLNTGPEIWEQTQGECDVFVAGMGTGGTISGAGKFLKEKTPDTQIVGVDPVGSLYYDFVKSGRITKPFTYKVEGIGEDFFPSTMNLKIIDEIIRVDDKECFLMTRDLVRLEGLYVGGSAGAAVAGAIKYAQDDRQEAEHPGALAGQRAEVSVQDLQRRLDARERLSRRAARPRHRARSRSQGKPATSSARAPATKCATSSPRSSRSASASSRSSRTASSAASSPRSISCVTSSRRGHARFRHRRPHRERLRDGDARDQDRALAASAHRRQARHRHRARSGGRARHQDRSHRFPREAVDWHLSQLGHTSCDAKIFDCVAFA